MFMVDRQSLFHLLGIFGQCFEHEVKRKRRHERRLLCIGSPSMATYNNSETIFATSNEQEMG